MRCVRQSWAIVVTLACSGPPPPSPGVVITANPTSVCQGDDFKTPVHLDSVGSSPELTLVFAAAQPDAGTLNYSWSVTGAVCKGLPSDPNPCDVVIDPSSVDALGNLYNSDLLLTMAGDRPVYVSLTVTVAYADGTTGGSSTAQGVVPITPLDSSGHCPLAQEGP